MDVKGARAFLSGYGKSYSQLSAEDRDRMKRWYGVSSAADLERAPQKRMSKAKPPQKRMSKAKPPQKHVKARELVDRACRNKHLPAFLRKRYC